jgi:Ca2+-binding RTX toxin-like protein
MTTLTVTQDFNYGSSLLNNIDAITYNTADPSATAQFSAGSFGSGILNNVLITGDSKQDIFIVNMPTTGTFSAAGWQFSNWDGPDFVGINGTSGADIITAPSGSGFAFVNGGGGADILHAGSTATTFSYGAGSDIKAGEQVFGGAGQDAIRPSSNGSAPSYDFSLVALSSVEILLMDIGTADGAAKVTLAGSQIGSGGINLVSSGDIFHDALIVKGAAVDLSAVTFSLWTNNDDSITISGTKHANILIGSSQDDDIIGGRGRDHLTGGGNDDNFIFKSKMDSLKGATHRDVIQDFAQGSDLIDLHKIDANANKAGNQTFHFIDAKHFHHKAGELHFVTKSGFLLAEGDVNGDGHADFQIEVHGPATLLATDFVL